MDNIDRALLLSLISNKRFTVWTNSPSQLIKEFVSLVLHQQHHFEDADITTIDLMDCFKNKDDANSDIESDLILRMTNFEKTSYTFKKVILWKNLQHLELKHQKCLYEYINKIDQYDTNASKLHPNDIRINDYMIHKPDLFIIIPVLENNLYHIKIYPPLKQKFWFSINYQFESEQQAEEEVTKIKPLPFTQESYQFNVQFLRKESKKVYIAPDIKRYIYSLIVHTRNHRLTSLAPRESWLSTRSVDEFRELCVALVIVQNYNSDDKFVTPDFVKVAMRKIGYWLVDWECNPLFSPDPSTREERSEVEAENLEEIEYQKRIEINMLSGSWFGSDYAYVARYIQKSRSVRDDNSPTGYSNVIIEDVISKVKPPI
ncbi:uncharacterized protein RJT20DRAFT_126151 [Scheffersomyces xylosifermentans]|uniref:uncharacterized protein n=1 Tax=Scheffersomyces xylosifermentans TaxID=1304137 RepID=UPI00315C97C2